MDRARRFEQTIGKCRLAVIDVRDDTKIARQLDSHESRTMRGAGCVVNESTANRTFLLFGSNDCLQARRDNRED
jgi:hypothetical protein